MTTVQARVTNTRHEVIWGREVIAPLILKLDTG